MKNADGRRAWRLPSSLPALTPSKRLIPRRDAINGVRPVLACRAFPPIEIPTPPPKNLPLRGRWPATPQISDLSGFGQKAETWKPFGLPTSQRDEGSAWSCTQSQGHSPPQRLAPSVASGASSLCEGACPPPQGRHAWTKEPSPRPDIPPQAVTPFPFSLFSVPSHVK